MRRLLIACTIAVLALAPAAAAAAPRQITLDEHLALLQRISGHLERVSTAVSADAASGELIAARSYVRVYEEVVVTSPHGEVLVNSRPLEQLLSPAPGSVEGRRRLVEANTLVQQYIAEATALQQGAAAPLPPDARARLEKALRDAETARTWYERLSDWLGGILGRWFGGGSSEDEGRTIDRRVWQWGGLAAGLIGLGLLGRGLIRSLSGHAPGEEAALRGAKALPDRPLTAAEMRGRARQLAQEGAHLEALRTVHLAVLRHLDDRGLIRYHPAHTNREHERQLRRRFPGLARNLHTLHDLVEDRLYAGHGASVGDFAAAEGLAEQLWREGDAVSRSAEATSGASSSAPLR